MLPQIAQSDGNCETAIDSDKVLAARQGIWTLETLGIKLEEKSFTKEDFEEALKRTSRKVKK